MKPYLLLLICFSLVSCDDGFDQRDPSVFARIIETEDDLIGGPIAQGQIGDILLENSEIRIILQRPSREIALLPYGGTLIDADIKRTAENSEDTTGQDVFRELGLFINLAHTFRPDQVSILADGSSGGDAIVRFEGKTALLDYINLKVMVEGVIDIWEIPEGYDEPIDVNIIQDYILSPGENRVRMVTTLRNDTLSELPLLFAWFFDPGGDLAAFAPGSEAFDQGLMALIRFLGLMGSGPVSYGFIPAGDDRNLMINAVGVLGLAPKTDVADLLNFPLSSPRILAPGEEVSFESAFVVGDGDLGKVLEAVAQEDGQLIGEIQGKVTIDGNNPAAKASLALTRPSGTPVAALRANEAGEFFARVAEGEYEIHAILPGHPKDQRDTALVTVNAGETSDVSLALGRGATIQYRLLDAKGELAPGKVTVVGFDPNPVISLFQENDDDPLPFGISTVSFSATGEGEITLSPGRYQLVATRGLEFERFVQEITVEAGDGILFEASLPRVVDTEGYISSDFHVHSAFSSDSKVFFADRLVSMIAEGMEFFAATEHEFILDPRPEILRLGFQDRIAAMSGEEITTVGYGHFGAFPLPVNPFSSNGGAIDWSNEGDALDPQEIFAQVNDLPGEQIVQINHPRRSPVGVIWNEYFDQIDLVFDQNGPLLGPLSRDPVSFRLDKNARMISQDFHAIEIYNWLNIGGLSDWFNFLNTGTIVAGTGNSDSHTKVLELSGFPRNFLRVGNTRDNPETITETEIVDAIRNLHMTVSGGPFVTIRARNAQGEAAEGELLSAAGGLVSIDVRIQAPTWIPFDSVKLYENGVLIAEDTTFTPSIVPGVEGGTRQEITLTFPVLPSGDAHYIAIVRGEGNLYPWVPYNVESEKSLDDLFAGNVEGAPRPQSFTNPVFVDENNDGVFTPSRQIVAVEEIEEEFQFSNQDDINPVP